MVVGQFMQHRFDQSDLIQAEKGRVQRVGEPAQRREGCGRSQPGVEALGREVVAGPLGNRHREIGPIGHPTRNGKPPGPEGESVLIGRGENQSEGVRREFGKRCVRIAGVPESQLLHGEMPGVPHQAKLATGCVVRGRVRHHLREGHAGREDLCLRPASPGHVDGVAGRQNHETDPESEEDTG